MYSRFISRKQFAVTESPDPSWGKPIEEITFYRLCDGDTKQYGVAIALKRIGNDEEREFEIAQNITSDPRLIEMIIRLLIEHDVTPSSLRDILDDIMHT